MFIGNSVGCEQLLVVRAFIWLSLQRHFALVCSVSLPPYQEDIFIKFMFILPVFLFSFTSIIIYFSMTQQKTSGTLTSCSTPCLLLVSIHRENLPRGVHRSLFHAFLWVCSTPLSNWTIVIKEFWCLNNKCLMLLK